MQLTQTSRLRNSTISSFDGTLLEHPILLLFLDELESTSSFIVTLFVSCCCSSCNSSTDTAIPLLSVAGIPPNCSSCIAQSMGDISPSSGEILVRPTVDILPSLIAFLIRAAHIRTGITASDSSNALSTVGFDPRRASRTLL